ncbi:MAG: carboxymuconolactone decarboxylase family protein [Caldilineales bacterium]|nr:carboxymuconolactone decarboxylase family protein [Caldilineales bacterium]MDW8319404.1 carboxymuconolactone decarboxylase family protein [Anaerolineae bacterium]
MSHLPSPYQRFQAEHAAVWEAYNHLGAAVHGAGPLDDRARALVKLGMAIAARQEGGVHSQVRKALEVGLTADEIRHAVLLAIPTIGFPATMAALTWAEDVLAQD